MPIETTYTIFQLVEPDCLVETKAEWCGIRQVERSVLEEISIEGVRSSHASNEEALREILKNASRPELHYARLVILPVLTL